jgi:two-component system NtrC family sensor kinase
LVEETTELIEQSVHGAGIELALDLDPALQAVWVDEDLIKQVVMNMLVNAQHAIGTDGRISVRTRQREDHRPGTAVGPPAAMAEITIRDTGCGIPEQDLQKIFDPFFTTKGVGKGTGLGLSVSHGTIKAHGGSIEVESRVGQGSEFRIYLPLDETPAGDVTQDNS